MPCGTENTTGKTQPGGKGLVVRMTRRKTVRKMTWNKDSCSRQGTISITQLPVCVRVCACHFSLMINFLYLIDVQDNYGVFPRNPSKSCMGSGGCGLPRQTAANRGSRGKPRQTAVFPPSFTGELDQSAANRGLLPVNWTNQRARAPPPPSFLSHKGLRVKVLFMGTLGLFIGRRIPINRPARVVFQATPPLTSMHPGNFWQYSVRYIYGSDRLDSQ